MPDRISHGKFDTLHAEKEQSSFSCTELTQYICGIVPVSSISHCLVASILRDKGYWVHASMGYVATKFFP